MRAYAHTPTPPSTPHTLTHSCAHARVPSPPTTWWPAQQEYKAHAAIKRCPNTLTSLSTLQWMHCQLAPNMHGTTCICGDAMWALTLCVRVCSSLCCETKLALIVVPPKLPNGAPIESPLARTNSQKSFNMLFYKLLQQISASVICTRHGR